MAGGGGEGGAEDEGVYGWVCFEDKGRVQVDTCPSSTSAIRYIVSISIAILYLAVMAGPRRLLAATHIKREGWV